MKKKNAQVGFIGNNPITISVTPLTLAEGFGGYALSNKATALIQNQFPELPGGKAAPGVIKLALAWGTRELVKRVAPDMLADAEALALGMAISGGLNLYQEFAPAVLKDFVGVQGVRLRNGQASRSLSAGRTRVSTRTKTRSSNSLRNTVAVKLKAA